MGHDAIVDSVRLDGALTATAEAIRGKTGKTEPITFDMDEGFKSAVEVIEVGGDTEAAYNDGVEAGRKAEYDAFWDEFQRKGGEANYYYAFSYDKFNDTNYNPKYDIVCSSGANTSSQYMFLSAPITDTKVAIYANGNAASYAFSGCTDLHTIRKLVVHDSLSYNTTFGGCRALVNISFEGVIGKNISFSVSSLLSDTSIQSIIDHLKDLTGATAQTLTFHATVGGKLTPEQKAAITAKNWTLVY
jgi:hypothetical protein